MPPPEPAPTAFTPEERIKIFSIAWLSAAADDILGSKEKRLLREYRKRLRIPDASAREIEKLARMRKLRVTLPRRPEAREAFFLTTLRMVGVDRGIPTIERRLVGKIGTFLGLNATEINGFLRRAENPGTT